MLLKCCTQHDSKFGKPSTGHRTGKGVFILIPKKGNTNNAQITTQFYSSHILAKYCSKFSKPGFNSTLTVNFQMFKQDLEKAEELKNKIKKKKRKAEEPEIKLLTCVGLSKM